jgi:hypothetical protein
VRQALAAVAVVALAIGVIWLREETESRHYPTHPDSTVTIVVDADTNRAEPSQTLHEMTAAQLSFCRHEVNSDLVGEVVPLADDPTQFELVLRPALDETDRVQYEGCVEDWLLDHLRLRIVSYERNGPFLPGEPGAVAS